MSDSSTYSRGDSFEIKTFELFKKLLDNDDFYVSGKRSKIFRKKGYYSEKRKSTIIFDIAIETYLNNNSNYALLTLIECKNYQSSVPVNDLEEFDSKIRQISEHNTKGILITNSTFQYGSYNFAQSAGIGLARVNGDDEFEWLVHRKANNDALLKKADAIILLENDANTRPNFLAMNGEFVLQTVSELLIQSQVIDFFTYKEKFINIPFITAQKIDYIVQKLEGHGVFNGKMLDEIKLYRFLETKYSVTFDFETTLPDNILGKITFSPLKISKSLKPDINRWRFTLAHEIGHLILHSKLLQEKVTEKADTDYSLSFKYAVSEATTRRIEYQANLFASHLLLLISTLIKDVAVYFTQENIYKRTLYWDNQPVNQNLVFNLLTRLSTLYGVSIEVVRIRLITLGLLIDNRYKSIKDILKEMRYM